MAKPCRLPESPHHYRSVVDRDGATLDERATYAGHVVLWQDPAVPTRFDGVAVDELESIAVLWSAGCQTAWGSCRGVGALLRAGLLR